MSRWVEMVPRGPHPAGDVGGDIQAGPAFSRRWIARHRIKGQVLVIEQITYAIEIKGRRSIETQSNGYLGDYPADAPLAEAEIDLGDTDQRMDVFHGSYTDGPADEPWPTVQDVKSELGAWDGPRVWSWDGTPMSGRDDG